MMVDEELTGRDLAEVLKFLAGRVQEGLDEGQDIVAQLRTVATKLEEKRRA